MAAAGGGDDTQLSFPLPPTFYYERYSDLNIKKGNVPKPPAVVCGAYTMFGHGLKTDDKIIQPLESQGIKRLYSNEEGFDHIVEMKKLNHSILVNYMELLDIMIDAPASPERQKKIEEIKILFINLHHLINEFRPHQARETLRLMLYLQKQQRLETAEKLKKVVEKARSMLKTCGSNLNTFPFNLLIDSSVDDKKNVFPAKSSISSNESARDLQFKIMCDIVDEIT